MESHDNVVVKMVMSGRRVTSLLNVFTKRDIILDSDKRVCDNRNRTRMTYK